MNTVQTAASITKSLTLECDVCIIGSGAGGAMLAAGLAQQGLDVVMLEAGPYKHRADFNMDESKAFANLYQSRGLQATQDASISLLQGSNVGGGTTINWTSCFRTPPAVLEIWRQRFGLSGLTPDALAPHFDAVEARLNVTEWQLNLANANNQTLIRGAQKLDWEVSPLRRNVSGCVNSGYCGMGCPVNAKQGMLLTTIPDALKAGMRLFSEVVAQKLVVKNNQVTEVHASVKDPDTGRPGPHQIVVRPKRVVSSCGAIHGPALLLRSGIDDNGLVGKRTFIHPVVGLAAEFAEPINGFYGAPQSASSHQFIHRGANEVGFFIESAPTHPILAATAATHFGANAQGFMSRLSHLAFLIAIHHDGVLPDDQGGEVALKSDGRPTLNYAISNEMRAAFEVAHVKLTELALAAGSKETSSLHLNPVRCRTKADIGQYAQQAYGAHQHGIFSAHQMGGLTMGSDPKNSVINPDFRHHRIKNLFAVDGSVFPTALGVNPSLTIYALAHMARQRIAASV
jgi:choline dehydrogenase-like flavoprotein